jgi:hypothetical protein
MRSARLPRSVPFRARLTAIAVVLAVVAAVIVLTTRGGSAESSAPPAPSGASACRSNPMAHVHDPSRLSVTAPCAAVSGTIKSVHLDPAFDDQKVIVAVDTKYVRYLTPANHGQMLIDVIATDLTSVTVPDPGSHATFYGAWVLNKSTKAAALLPTWRILDVTTSGATSSGTSKSKPKPLHQGQTLALSLQSAPTTTTGGRLIAYVHTEWVQGAKRAPASQVRVFLEATTPDGTGVRWKAALTNTLGMASMKLVSLQVPGPYRLTAYAFAVGRSAETSTNVTIVRP